MLSVLTTCLYRAYLSCFLGAALFLPHVAGADTGLNADFDYGSEPGTGSSAEDTGGAQFPSSEDTGGAQSPVTTDGGQSTGGGGSLSNPLKFDNLQDFLAATLDAIAQIALPFVVLAVIYSGFLFVTARGNEDKLNKAKTAFFWTVIGALIVLGASAISAVIEGTITQLLP